ncbi:MAG: cell division ATPase MinD [Candidatus Parvarchaeota archaeon]|nr:cell division ATPase MinD [Candidatus Jingweiarchaeum tengchongense]MCW1298448.1 cell division ATPase MinD [Candidatus Jingweiarchaeum tengchongense]MCW1300540.1 cell division ATPase MinD [Candidatus Jingweiarchaeum tengchongense]MCW1304985.1 cell division ATPase MinD [Candidatus Jingweiarchaeum tengchongense]MCW1310858.1 cell division ATPase MinD [Candidatus Jingweiarchaeum tengchongense]
MTRIIAVASGKGGVGKTTLSINLASALHEFGRDVILVDGNITTANVSIHLGIPKTPTTIHDVLKGKIKNLKEAVYIHPLGLKVVPASIAVHELKSKHKKRFTDAIIDIVGVTDFIIIDCPAGLGLDAKHAIESADELLVATNPELPAIIDALKVIRFAKELGVKPIGVVVNEYRGDTSHELSPKNIEEFLELPVLAVIPWDENVRKAIALKKPVVFSFPDSLASIEFKKLAARLIGYRYKIRRERKSMIERLKKFFRMG